MTTQVKRKPQAGREGGTSFKVIERPNLLKSKAGDKGLPPRAMERAQQAALAMKDDCLEEVIHHLSQIEDVVERERSGDHKVLRSELSRLAAQVYAFCGTCGLDIVGNIAKSLDRLAMKEGPMDDGDLALIKPHLSAIAFAAAEFSRPDGSEDHCKILLKELQEAVAGRLG